MGNLTKWRKTGETRFFVVPDSVIVGNRDKIGYETHLCSNQQLDGTATTVGTARDEIPSLKLDQASRSASGLSTSVDPKEGRS